jgi:hypothetical protein
MRNVSSNYRNFFHRHKNTQNDTLRFGRKLLPSSGAGDISEVQFYLKANSR